MQPLNYRRRLFVEHYLGESSGSAVDAARRAGYRWPETQGPRLVKTSGVRAAIDARVGTAAMAASEVLARVADLASADLTEFIDVNTQSVCKVDLKLVKRRGLGHLIKRVQIKKDGTTEIDLEAKLPALVKLGEYYKLWKGEAEQQITMVDVAKELEARYEKLRKDKESGDTAEDLP
jgi:phage terminase small subunit